MNIQTSESLLPLGITILILLMTKGSLVIASGYHWLLLDILVFLDLPWVICRSTLLLLAMISIKNLLHVVSTGKIIVFCGINKLDIVRFLRGVVNLTRYYWHQWLNVICKQWVVSQMMIDLRVVCLCQDILKHLLFGEGDPTRLLGFQNVALTILLRRFSLLLSRFIGMNRRCNIILHIFWSRIISLLLSFLTLGFFILDMRTSGTVTFYSKGSLVRLPINNTRASPPTDSCGQMRINLNSSKSLIVMLLLL